MENASKFLLMAASFIFGLMLIAVFIFVFRAGAKTNESYESKQSSLMLEAYNSKFEVYDKTNNTILDLVTLFNLAYDVNKSIDYDPQSAIEINAILNATSSPITLGISTIKKLEERNTIWYNGTYKISIYDALNRKLFSGIPGEMSDFKITQVAKPEVIADFDGDGDTEEFTWPAEAVIKNTDTFLTTRYDSKKNKTIYKYVFTSKPDKTMYNQLTGKITYMEFEACFNYEYYL